MIEFRNDSMKSKLPIIFQIKRRRN